MALFDVCGLAVSLPRENGRAVVFSEVSLSLERGELCDLVGPSGSGKSTLLRACARMLEADAGSMLLDGEPASRFSPAEWRRRVCLVPQKPSLVAGTVERNLLLPWELKVRSGEIPPSPAVLRSMLDEAGLEDVGLDRGVERLSGGQAARVALLRAFAANADVYLLDEVDAALDEESAFQIGLLTARMVSRGRACLRIRHRPPDGLARRRLVLSDGTVSDVAMPGADAFGATMREGGTR